MADELKNEANDCFKSMCHVLRCLGYNVLNVLLISRKRIYTCN